MGKIYEEYLDLCICTQCGTNQWGDRVASNPEGLIRFRLLKTQFNMAYFLGNRFIKPGHAIETLQKATHQIIYYKHTTQQKELRDIMASSYTCSFITQSFRINFTVEAILFRLFAICKEE